MTNAFDYVVVGGGTSGCVLAARLAEWLDAEVCLIEEGPSDEGRQEILDLQRWPELLFSSYDRAYAVEAQPHGNTQIHASRAVVLGGCSSHNGCGAWRTPDPDLEGWLRAGAVGWGPEDVRDSLERVFAATGLTHACEDNEAAAAFVLAGEQAGFQRRNFGLDADGSRAGIGWTPLNAIGGKRRSSSVAYLHPLSALPNNLTVRTDDRAQAIRLDDRRAAGVICASGEIEARREIIVCCGAFDTPKLLMLSGIGPAAHLREMGLDVIADLPVGDHLFDHPEGVTTFALKRPMTAPQTMWADAVLVGRIDGSRSNRPEMMGWFFSGHFDEFTAKSGGPAMPTVSVGVDVLLARSEGTVRLRSVDPADAPRITLDYFTDQDGYDERIMVGALRLIRRVMGQRGMADWVEDEVAPGLSITSDDALSEYARSTVYTAYHPSGTCRMGAAEDPGVVLDARLRVRGVDRLRVADASIFPTNVAVNPNITCMMIGERAAELIAEDHGSTRRTSAGHEDPHRRGDD